MCYSRYGENILDKFDNRKVDDIEVRLIGIEIRNEQEEDMIGRRLEDMKGRDEGLETERVEERESENEITEIVEKENKLNNEEEIVPEMLTIV